MKKTIFISGLRKSGTSLVKNLLDNHPELFVFPPNELHFFKYSYHPSIVKDKSSLTREPSHLLREIAENKFIKRLADKSSDFFLPDFKYSEFLNHIERAHLVEFKDVYKALFHAFYQAMGNTGDPQSKRFVSKTVLETEFFPELLNWFPDIKFVYVLRNPYAHFVSAIKSLRTHSRKTQKETYEGMPLSNWKNPYPYLGPEIFRMKHSYYFMEKYQELYPDNFYVLVYDRLLEDREKELRALANFLEITYSDIMLEPTIFGNPWGGNSWRNERFNGISKAPLEQWKKDISGGEIRLLNKFFKEILQRYFQLEKSNTALRKRFHPSEYRPKIYVANRLLYYTNTF